MCRQIFATFLKLPQSFYLGAVFYLSVKITLTCRTASPAAFSSVFRKTSLVQMHHIRYNSLRKNI